MSDLDRILKLAGHGIIAQSSAPTDRDMKAEAVGESADPILDLCDQLGCDSDHPVLGELIRYLDGDTIRDFVSDFRRHNDMNDMEEAKIDEEPNEGNAFTGAQQGKKKGEKFKVSGKEFTKEDDVTTEGVWAVPETPEQIEKLKEIMSAPLLVGEDGDNAADVMYGILGDDELFDEFHSMSVDLGPDTDARPAIQARLVELGLMEEPATEEAVSEASGVCEACGCQIDAPKEGCECTHDSHDASGSHWVAESISDEAKEKAQDRAKNYESPRGEKKKKVSVAKAPWDKEDLDEAQSPAQKAAFAKMLASKGGKKDDKSGEEEMADDDKEELDESPTMDTTQLINLMKNSGLSEEKIKTKLDEWANTPDGAAEEEATSHGDPYEYAQSVNLSLKRYLDAEDMKVGITEHKVEDIKEAYKNAKNK
jgi:hypothetical protein|tara:strand:- start:22 stop:1290 length:1269 start_codon:yes stop_codon:yes gene_type:complete